MTITPVSSLPGVAAANAAASASGSSANISSTLNVDFTTYLKILTTQLQNQDPTNATDPNQFTQELIQIEQVQVQNNTNTDLESLTKATATNGLATGVAYIGNYVQASSSTGAFPLQGGSAEFGYTLASAANTSIVNVEDANGNVVAQLNGGTAAGPNYVAWNGLESDGTTTAPDGTYTFNVAATDASGNVIAESSPVSMFRINSVESNTDGTLQLLAGTLSLSTSDVTGLYTASTLPTTTYNSAYNASTG